MKKSFLFLTLALLILHSCLAAAPTKLTKVATSSYQWTGVAISKEDRIFVNYPTWKNYPVFKVAELKNGTAQAYPTQEAQAQFTCVQSVYVDGENNLWVVDPAKLHGQQVAPSGAKLFKYNLNTDQLSKTYVFPASTVLPDTYLNDVRVDNHRNFAYLTDSSVGGIIVLNLSNGSSWRALDNVPEVKANLPGINFASTGFSKQQTQSDGLELSKDGNTLYFSALTGNKLYSISTNILRNTKLQTKERRLFIKTVNAHNVPTDGMLLKGDTLYMANLPAETIWAFDLKTRTGRNLSLPEQIRWADSFALDPLGKIYFTTSQINYPEKDRVAYALYRLEN